MPPPSKQVTGSVSYTHLKLNATAAERDKVFNDFTAPIRTQLDKMGLDVYKRQLLNIYGSKYMIRMPGNGVEQFHFRAIFNDFFYPLLFNAPVFGNIKKLVVRETDITAFTVASSMRFV